jgi:hypothetical protein
MNFIKIGPLHFDKGSIWIKAPNINKSFVYFYKEKQYISVIVMRI